METLTDKQYYFNKKLTPLIRKDYPYMWSTWELNADIMPGAIGCFDEFHTFQPIVGVNITDCEGDFHIQHQAESFRWSFSSKYVSSNDFSAKGGDIGVHWEFDDDESVVSNFSVNRVSELKNVKDAINQQSTEWLKERALDCYNPRYKNGKFLEGFCVVTKVIYAKGGLNLHAAYSGDTFKVWGSSSGIGSMLGGGDAEAAFSFSHSDGEVQSNLWTPKKSTNPNPHNLDCIPIAFEVATIVSNDSGGYAVLECWTHEHNYFGLCCNGIMGTDTFSPMLRPKMMIEEYNQETGTTTPKTFWSHGSDTTAVAIIPEYVTSFKATIYDEYGEVKLFEQAFVPKYDFPFGGKAVEIFYGGDPSETSKVYINDVQTKDGVINYDNINDKLKKDKYWNFFHTRMMRKDSPYKHAWSNWTLSSDIQVGAMGCILQNAATFVPFAGQTVTLLNSKTEHAESYQFKIKTESVWKEEFDADIPGLTNMTWHCDDYDSLVSTFNMSRTVEMNNPHSTLIAQMSELEAAAREYGYCDSNGIVEGFCVITKVYYAKGGFNLGSHVSGSTFSLTGKKEGLDAMVHKGSAEASFHSSTQYEQIDQHTFPLVGTAENGGAANDQPADIPVFFEVAMIDHGQVQQLWTGNPMYKYNKDQSDI